MKVEGHAGWTYEGLIVAMADRLLEPELEQLDLFGGAA